ncbi:Uncharacterised protein [Bordetella pertussis]|nr:Uncharacterised protein [Bordetella pertussis]
MSTGRPSSARACSSNSFCTWEIRVTMPVSCGRGLTSENQTWSPATNSSTPNMPRPPRSPVTARAISRERCSATGDMGWGCQLST